MRRFCACICSKRSCSAKRSNITLRNCSSSASSSSRIAARTAFWCSFAAIISADAAACCFALNSFANRNFSSFSSKYSRSSRSSISSRRRSFSSFSFVSRSMMRSASSRFAAPICDAASSRRAISSAKRAMAASSSRRRRFSSSRASSRRERNFLTQVCVSRTFCALRMSSASSSSLIFAATASTASRRSARNAARASFCAAFFSSICSSKSTRAAPRDSPRRSRRAPPPRRWPSRRWRSASACVAASTSASRASSIARSSRCSRRSKFTSAARSFSLSAQLGGALGDLPVVQFAPGGFALLALQRVDERLLLRRDARAERRLALRAHHGLHLRLLGARARAPRARGARHPSSRKNAPRSRGTHPGPRAWMISGRAGGRACS